MIQVSFARSCIIYAYMIYGIPVIKMFYCNFLRSCLPIKEIMLSSLVSLYPFHSTFIFHSLYGVRPQGWPLNSFHMFLSKLSHWLSLCLTQMVIPVPLSLLLLMVKPYCLRQVLIMLYNYKQASTDES